MQSCNSLRMNTEKQSTTRSNLFGTEDGVMEYVLYYSLGVLGIGLLIGAPYEGFRYYRRNDGIAIPYHDEENKIRSGLYEDQND